MIPFLLFAIPVTAGACILGVLTWRVIDNLAEQAGWW